MYLLYDRLGEPPYHFAQVLSILEEAQDKIKNTQLWDESARDDATSLIEMLEAIAYHLDHCFEHTLQWPEATRPIKSCHDPHISAKVRRVLMSIPTEVIRLKECLFEALGMPRLCRSRTGCGSLCQHCSWAFARIRRGKGGPDAFNWKFCQAGDMHVHPYLHTVDRLPDFPMLQERSSYGCEFCSLVRRSICAIGPAQLHLTSNPEEDRAVWLTFNWHWPFGDRDGQREGCLAGVGVSIGRMRALGFIVESNDQVVASELGIRGSPQASTLSSTNLTFIRKQLKLSAQHVESNDFLPKRLLDIDPGPGHNPKLRITSQKDRSNDAGGDTFGKFAALSYCWGTTEEAKSQPKLSIETYEQFQAGIPLASMTPVLQDAVTVCHALDIRYLWVDALCVMQDDSDQTDWEEQTYEMGRIFGNAWLTICAVASSSCTQGFLDHIDRQSPAIRLDYIPGDRDIAGSITLRLVTMDGELVRESSLEYGHLSTDQPLERDLRTSKWRERGWVFQEMNLSPRKIYFGSRMIHFQYGSTIASENELTSNGHDRGLQSYRHPLDLTQDGIMSYGSNPIDVWYKVVESFAGSRFTNTTDIFPAHSGIVKNFYGLTEYHYLAGLWQEDLHRGLLWHTMGGGYWRLGKTASLKQVLQLVSRSVVAPSWSWAGRNWHGRTPWFITMSHLRPEFQVIETRIRVDGANPFGRLSKASILMSAKTVKLPSGSLPGYDALGNQRWQCTTPDGLFADLLPDWRPVEPGGLGINRSMQKHLRLLLVASRCSRSWARSQSCDECSQLFDYAKKTHHTAVLDVSYTMCHQPETQNGPQDKPVLEESKDKLEGDNREESDDGHDPKISDCSLCSDEHLRRDVWGLLVYPARHPGTYYRVGMFSSRAQHLGSGYFQDAETSTIELI